MTVTEPDPTTVAATRERTHSWQDPLRTAAAAAEVGRADLPAG